MIGAISHNSISSLVSTQRARMNQIAYQQAMAKLARRPAPAAHPVAHAGHAERLSALAALEAEETVSRRAQQVSGTADAALGEISNLLSEARGLASEAVGTLSGDETAASQVQIDSILASVDRLAQTTQFGGTKLLDGTGSISVTGKSLSIRSMATADLGTIEVSGARRSLRDVMTGGQISVSRGASDASRAIDAAIGEVATARGQIGAFERHHITSRLSAIQTAREQLAAAEPALAAIAHGAEHSSDVRRDLLAAAARFGHKLGRGPLGSIVNVTG